MVFYFNLFYKGHPYAHLDFNPLPIMLLRRELCRLLCFYNSNYGNVLLSVTVVTVCLDAQILQKGKQYSGWPLCRPREIQNFFRNATEMEFPGKVPISWRVAPCFWYNITSWCSYHILVHVHCAAIRTIICKDLAVPYPSSKDYEYQEDYLHRQMKEWACIHSSKRLSNDRCENRVRSYWATGSLLGEKSLLDFCNWLQGCSL